MLPLVLSTTRSLCVAIFAMAIVGFGLPSVPTQANDQSTWSQLREQVQTRLDDLTELITQAKSQGIETEYAMVSVETIKAFQNAAQWDHDNVEEVRRLFKTFRFFHKTDPTEADKLAGNEMQACLQVADHAIAELHQQMAGERTLAATPDFADGDLSLGPGYYQLNGEIVFPYTIVWLPKVDSTMPDALGRIGETYFALSSLKPDGTYDKFALKQRVDSARIQAAQHFSPLYHFWGHIPAKWMIEQHPDAMLGGRRFTQYDIDNPLVRTWIEQLCEGFLPPVADAYGDKPLLYLLANEPHFATAQGGWMVKNGQSVFTQAKYQRWLAEKYGQVEELNAAHRATYQDFASVEMPFPIQPKLRGGPVWYDWCRFNMDRVNEWFSFLKETSQSAVAGHDAPVTIKMLGHHLVDGQRDQGMDIEYLVNLQDVTGGDLRIQPHDATFYTHLEGGLDAQTSWTSRYSYGWVSQGLFLDFVRSLAPEKPFFDSEWHGFGAVHWRHFELDRNYVRAALWHGFSNGMGMIEPWMWGRQPDGSMRNQADQIGELATQPIAVDAYGRTMKELNAFASLFAAAGTPTQRRFMLFYCEESAIQNAGYAEQLSTTYESLKLLNTSIGLTTPTHIKQLNVQQQVVIVPPTPFISDASLRSLRDFQDAGGHIVMVDADQSLHRTEMGSPREGDIAIRPVASLAMAEPFQLASQFEKVLERFRAAQPLQVSITNAKGEKCFGVFAQQVTDPKTNRLYVILNNASRESLTVTIRPSHSPTTIYADAPVRSGSSGNPDAASRTSITLSDAITQQPIQSPILLNEYDVRLIEVKQ
ncbi:beta-galactosidase [Neorhodopirellula lusitana]|uniref:beta-galactosidase n=1 Tax=Neorhodopirellula lusitana TaxID=445327 RepID=UPI00384BFCB1